MKVTFDKISSIYDQQFSYSEIGKVQRKEVWKYLDPMLNTSTPMNILLMNCGTGVDAIYLAKKGHDVLATDISGEMVKASLRKVAHHGLSDKIAVIQLGFEELNEGYIGGNYDLIITNFGCLNSLNGPGLQRLAYDFSGLLKPGGRCVSIVMPNTGFTERLYHASRLRLSRTFGNRQDHDLTAFSGTGISIWYHSPKKLKRIFSGAFNYVQSKPIGFLLPPSISNTNFRSGSKRLKFWAWVSKAFNGLPVFAAWSEFYLIDLELKR